MKPKAYSYLRFSTPEQSKGDSLRRQTESAKLYAELHDLELDEMLTFRDLGVSAFRGNNTRDGNALGAFFTAVNEGIIEEGSYLLVESLDRMSRDAVNEAAGMFLLLINRGIVIVTLLDNKEYSKAGLAVNPYDLMMSVGIMIRAHEESETKGRRLREAWKNKRAGAANTPLTAKAPGWLTLVNRDGKRVFEVIEDRANTVRRIYDMTLGGHGQHAIEKTLNSENVPVFGRGKQWHRSFIIKLLTNPAVIGTYTPHTLEHENGRKVRKPQGSIPNYFPAIIDVETFQRVQSLRLVPNAPLRGKNAGKPMVNIFGGLSKCPLCGASMILVNKGKRGRKSLVCSKAKTGAGCQYKAIHYEQLEKAYSENFEWLVHTMPMKKGNEDLQKKIEDTEMNLEMTRESLNNWLNLPTTERTPSIIHAIREADATVESLEKDLAKLYREKDILTGGLLERKLGELRKALEVPTIDKVEVNTLLRQLLSSVTVDYPNGSLDFHWKHGGVNSIIYGWPTEEHL